MCYSQATAVSMIATAHRPSSPRAAFAPLGAPRPRTENSGCVSFPLRASVLPALALQATGRCPVRIETKPLSWFKPNDDNYRRHPGPQVEHIRQSLRELGQYKNIVARPDGTLLAGHGVLAAAQAEGQADLAVHIFQGTDAEARKLMVADNELSRLAEDDEAQLATLLKDLDATGELPGTGWTGDALQALLASLETETRAPLEDLGPEDPPEEPVTRPGDLWLCGEHRVLCGDATVETDWAALMQGATVQAILTDPPYQMGKDIAGDDLGDEDFADLHKDFIALLPSAAKCTFVCFHSPRTFPVALDAARQAGWKFERMLWLYKAADITFPWRGWIMTSEALLVCTVGGGSWRDVKPYAQDCYRIVSAIHGNAIQDGESSDHHGPLYHPTVKPLAVVADVLRRLGDTTVADPFLGSGTTLIAAEQLGRRCYGMDIEPRYVDVAVKRWQKATGKRATLEATGLPFPGE